MRRVFVGAFLCILCGVLSTLSWAADARIRVIRQAASTSTGTQDFVISGAGSAKGAFIIANYATSAAGTGADTAGWSMGFTDCTNQVVFATIDRNDALITSDANRRATDDAAIMFLTDTLNATTVDGEATASCITDGIQLNWSNAPALAYQIQMLVWYGDSGVQTKVGTFQSANSVNGTVDIATVGFLPEGVFCLGSGTLGTWTDTTNEDSRLGVGVATATAQGGIVQASNDAVMTTAYGGEVSTLYACGSAVPGDTLDGPVSLDSFDSQGFTGTTRLEAHPWTQGYFAYTTGGAVASWAGSITAPAAPETTSYTAPNFEPQAYVMFLMGVTTHDFEDVTDNAGMFGIAIGDGVNQYSITTRGDDGATTINVGSISSPQAIVMRNVVGENRWAGTLEPFLSNGWAINYTTATAAGAWYGWAIQQMPSIGGSGLPQWMR